VIWDAAALMISLETVAATDANDSSIRLLLLSHSVTDARLLCPESLFPARRRSRSLFFRKTV